jgi:co-chaperonin GroES (HSP10)
MKMSELFLPPHVAQEAAEVIKTASQLPKPQGYKLLCALPKIEDAFDKSGLVKADITKEHEELMTVVLFVLDMGPDAYKDAQKFPTGPYCKKGDFVLVRPYSGTRLTIHGTEFRIINDDQVEAVVDNPIGIKRA